MLLATLTLALALQGPAFDPGPSPTVTVERVLALGHPGALRLTGAASLDAERVLAGLREDRDFLEASHPSRELDVYLRWLEGGLTLGYQHLGFASVVVEARADRATGEIELAVREGPRLLAGEVLLEGARLLDPQWLRAVLRSGDVQRIASTHLPAPPGPSELEPALRLDAGKPMPPAFWVPGEPAPVSEPDRRRFEGLARQAARAAGLRAAEVSVRWDRIDADTLHPVVVVEEGPLHQVERVRIEGEHRDPPRVLLDQAAIPAGTPANEAVLQAAVDRLQATGRFGSVVARYAPLEHDPSRVELVLQVVDAPTVPPLELQPAEDLALLRRAMVRLSEGDAHPLGLDVRLTLSGERLRPVLSKGAALGLPLADGDRLGLHVSLSREFAALELLLMHEGAGPRVLARLYADGQRGLASCPPLGVHLVFPAPRVSWWLDVVATYATPSVATDEGFDLSLSGGVGTWTLQPSSPLRVSPRVSPSALLYLYSRGAPPAAPDPERLVRLGAKGPAHLRAAVERADARAFLEIDIESEELSGSVDFGDLRDLEPPAWAESMELATAPSLDEALAAFDTLRAAGPSTVAAGANQWPERVLLLAGLHACVSPPRSEPDAGRGPTAPFFVPRPTPSVPAARSELRDQVERLVVRAIARLPRDAWSVDLLRAAPFLLFPASQNELLLARATMVDLAGRDDLGPLGAWCAAELCAHAGQRGWAANLARAGRGDLSNAAFLADCGALLDLDAGPTARAVGRAWHALHARAFDEADGTLRPRERELLLSTFDGLGSGDESGAWLRAGLARLFEARLRDLVADRLATLERG